MCADFQTELIEFNGENNHAHLPVNFPPPAPRRTPLTVLHQYIEQQNQRG